MQTGLTPQWYFKPNEVWEVSAYIFIFTPVADQMQIRGADITLSSVLDELVGVAC